MKIVTTKNNKSIARINSDDHTQRANQQSVDRTNARLIDVTQ
jgi:hypothetical protein